MDPGSAIQIALAITAATGENNKSPVPLTATSSARFSAALSSDLFLANSCVPSCRTPASSESHQITHQHERLSGFHANAAAPESRLCLDRLERAPMRKRRRLGFVMLQRR